MKLSRTFIKKLKANPFVYHYTTVEAMFSLLEGYRLNGLQAIPVRAYCIYNSNDPREMELGYDIIKNILLQHEGAFDNSLNLSEIYSNPEYEKQCKDNMFPRPINGIVEMASVPYSVSFSCKRDFLPMWSMYGCGKKGVCLKFNMNSLIDEMIESLQLCYVHYKGEKENIIADYMLPLLYN